MSAARGDAPGAGVLPGGRVLIMGGVSGSPTATSASSDIYDPVTNTFSLGPAMHTSRALFPTVTLAGGGILVAGGATLPPGAAAPP